MSTATLSSALNYYDASAVEDIRELYRTNTEPTRKDLENTLTGHTGFPVLDGSGQPVRIDVDLSSMHTTARDLIQQLGEKTLKIGNVDTTLADLTHDPESTGFWLWLAIEVAKVLGQGEDPAAELTGGVDTWVYKPYVTRRWYRHRVAGPVGAWIWREKSKQDAARNEGLIHALGNNSLATGEVYEQTVSRASVMETNLLDRMKNTTADKYKPEDARVLGLKLNQAATAWDPEIAVSKQFEF